MTLLYPSDSNSYLCNQNWPWSHHSLTERVRKEGQSKARGRKRPVTECSGPAGNKATQVVCGAAGVRMPVSWLQVQCWIGIILPIMLVFLLWIALPMPHPALARGASARSGLQGPCEPPLTTSLTWAVQPQVSLTRTWGTHRLLLQPGPFLSLSVKELFEASGSLCSGSQMTPGHPCLVHWPQAWPFSVSKEKYRETEVTRR